MLSLKYHIDKFSIEFKILGEIVELALISNGCVDHVWW